MEHVRIIEEFQEVCDFCCGGPHGTILHVWIINTCHLTIPDPLFDFASTETKAKYLEGMTHASQDHLGRVLII